MISREQCDHMRAVAESGEVDHVSWSTALSLLDALEEMAKALEPFAAWAKDCPPEGPDDEGYVNDDSLLSTDRHSASEEDLRTASRVLSSYQKKTGGAE